MAISMKIYSDYMCPFCYLALAYVNELKKTWDLDVEWISFELHPDTPQEGIMLADRFGESRTAEMVEGLRRKGRPFGIEFGDLYFMPNSRKVLEASEYAKEKGAFEEFHKLVFEEHFTNLADIGKVEVLKDLLERCGMDSEDFAEALEEEVYTERIETIHREALSAGVGKTPFFVVEDRFSLERPGSIDDIIEVLRQTGKESGQMDEKKMRLLLEDNSIMECDVIGKFEVEDKVYIALLPEGNEDVLLYRFFEKDGEIELDRIEEDEEYYNVAEVYYDLFGSYEMEENEELEEVDEMEVVD